MTVAGLKIIQLREKFNSFDIDGYIVPKNDEFFSEFSIKDRLRTISNFTGSAGCAIILKNKNYLFVDGRYTIQAKKESGKNFKITKYEKLVNCNLFKNLTLGFDPALFTAKQIKRFFLKYNKVKKIEKNLVDFKKNQLRSKPFFSLKTLITGENYSKKIKKVSKFLKKNNSNYLFVTAPENVAWLLNIRGHDNPYSPVPHCRLLINDKKKFFLFSEFKKTRKLIDEKKLIKKQIIDPKNFEKFINKFKKGKIIIDQKTCSISYENLLKKKFKILNKKDPIYLLKSQKNKKEIKNMIDCHIADGIAVSKFLYWIKNINKKKITELDAQKKLENLRKKNKNYLFPSFDTIAGTAENGAIVHYKANRRETKEIKKNDIFLCDSGGQYKYGTTDVTRTICFSKPRTEIKNIFTKVLKGHIAVVTANLNKYTSGRMIDNLARKNLKKDGLDYEHGTGHGVGFFLNVHEGPQAISKFNRVKIREGMIISNEPGYYKKGKFGIRIENLIYVSRSGRKLIFKNLTLAPIDKDLIDFNQLDRKEKNYLFRYHLDVYNKISKFLSKNERKWLASFI